MKKSIIAIMLGLIMVLALAGCGQGEEKASDDPQSEGSDYAALKIVLVLPCSIDDQSWNASNYAGAQAADAELGTHIEVVESVPVEEFESTEYGEKEYNIVMSAGSQFDEAAAAIVYFDSNTERRKSFWPT